MESAPIERSGVLLAGRDVTKYGQNEMLGWPLAVIQW
jgi:hypothetical protein